VQDAARAVKRLSYAGGVANGRCPTCNAPRIPMAYCPECRTPYPVETPEAGATRWTGAEDEARLELRLRRFAPPAALLVGWLVVQLDGLRAAVRILDSMWLHELGHAASAWLSGFAAFPGPWRTSISETRSPLLSLFIAAALAGGAYVAHRAGRRPLVIAAGALLALQLLLTVFVRPHRAQGLILFFGDGGAMILGAALVVTFWAPVGSYLHRTWLRWGFLVLGAFGFMDPFTTWWRARRDVDAIPYGEIDGVGDSDATRLVDVHGWSQGQLVARFVTVGVVCRVAIAVAGAAAWWRDRREGQG